MNQASILQRRLIQQQLAATSFSQPYETAEWMGAMQAQDYLASLWAVGVRLPGATEQQIEAALQTATIVRTWPMRGTIHLLAARDVRWMLDLLAPRVIKSSQGRLRQLEIDEATLVLSAEVLGRALEGRKQLTRPELYDVLAQARISAQGQRGNHILGQLSMRQVLCIGPRRGKQPTFVLLDEWIGDTPRLSREEALATVALRYFTSHGPATQHDFVHWTGLTITEAKRAIAAAGERVRCETVDGVDYYYGADAPDHPDESPAAYLLPPFDEWLLGYRDRAATLHPDHTTHVVPGNNGIFFPVVVVGGHVVGVWKRTFKGSDVVLAFTPFRAWTDDDHLAVRRAAERYAAFVGKRLVLAP